MRRDKRHAFQARGAAPPSACHSERSAAESKNLLLCLRAEAFSSLSSFNAIDSKTCDDLLELVQRWHSEQRTVLAAMHDLDVVKAHFPEALLLAREPVAWGATADVLTPENMLKARRMCEAFDEQAEACVVAEAV